MFETTETPRIFALAPGVDFPKALVSGLHQRFVGMAPQEIARTQIIVNTARMARRIQSLFHDGPAMLMPRIQLLGEFANTESASLPKATSPIRQRFELIQLVTRLLEQQPDLAARASVYDLADSLASLFDEMAGEGVSVETIETLDVADQSGHWARAQSFFSIARHFLDDLESAPGAEARQRRAIEEIIARWDAEPPKHPIILAGSTGSRGTMQLLMQAVARLPQGAVVLPGFDFEMPQDTWGHLSTALESEDHPQFRYHALLDTLGLPISAVLPWDSTPAPSELRNRLISLALRPAPVTDQWLSEGPTLGDLMPATENITLVEATTQREEALTIAARMRKAAEDGQTCALITPDRMLTRQVTAALDRWNIVPDDSAGQPLQLSPPGRFLRHIVALFHQKLTSEALLTLLKHPLTHSGVERGRHLLNTRNLELWLRRKGVTYPEAEAMTAWAQTQKDDMSGWMRWLTHNFCKQLRSNTPMEALFDAHISLAEAIAHGPLPDGKTGSGGLWQEAAGRAATRVLADVREHAPVVGEISPADYADLFGALLSRGEVRDRDAGHPHILIWGTLEARVQGADLVILGGLNEGSWPEAPSPDPWLNRKMRNDAGLLLPERRIGLAAHDFQQAVGAPEVWLTRAIRSDEAETVPSRWINRLTNLLGGLPDQNGQKALEGMYERAQVWLNRVRALETVPMVPPASRPSPTPPVAARPRRLSVTEIKRLIRDPYAIYAKHVLRLRPLDPLMRTPDALLRGIVVHEVLEKLVKESADQDIPVTLARIMDISESVLAQNVPWATARALWLARLARVSDHIVHGEERRRTRATPIAFEAETSAQIEELDFTLTAKADRIDRTKTGDLILYDYKTGVPPSKDEQTYFDKQLLLEAAMAEQNGFKGIDPAQVADAIYIGLGASPKDQPAPLAETPTEKVWEEFSTLISHYLEDGKGFTSRRAMQSERDEGLYDQLARFGEWDATDEPAPEELT
ncbi:double-strand break repair protein AddB [Shimia sp. MMG029]|uniref:double-strand break repair protein AddB n=1 Tax=Shimia sp. MMG029 TaxID=3021978 RepID=UPI0022FE6CAF|nr:double-strand break repair protein AddB [Shimia sp. MMG029]MDA5557350.1 double-strand break repair protein AddB [Shimia sp. MMG029]